MKKLFAFSLCLVMSFSVAGLEEADAAKKLKPIKRSELTKKQREAYMAEARRICKKKFGAPAQVARIDYYRRQVWCWPN